MRPFAIFTFGPIMLGLLACGSRSTLDAEQYVQASSAGSAGAGGAAGSTTGHGGSAGAGGSTSGRGGGAAAAGIVVPPIGGQGGFFVPGLDAGIGQACVGCVLGQCPDLATCAMDTSCAAGLVCTVTTCGGDGGLGLGAVACVASCFGGNWQLALSAITGITCVMQGCGPTCGFGS
jgi:hypothetical protein